MITHGMISFEDGVKSAVEYQPPRKVRVELHFDVPRGESWSAIIDAVADHARSKCYDLLGQKGGSEKAHEATAANLSAKTAEAVMDQVAGAVDQAPARRGRPRKAEPLPAVGSFPGASDGAQSTAKLEGDQAPGKAEAAIAFSDDPVPPKPEAAEVISDKKLYDVVIEINAKSKQGKAIAALIEKYCPADGVPPSLKRIHELKRAAFLAEVRKFAEEQAVVA